jgi:hypothetical protein
MIRDDDRRRPKWLGRKLGKTRAWIQGTDARVLRCCDYDSAILIASPLGPKEGSRTTRERRADRGAHLTSSALHRSSHYPCCMLAAAAVVLYYGAVLDLAGRRVEGEAFRLIVCCTWRLDVRVFMCERPVRVRGPLHPCPSHAPTWPCWPAYHLSSRSLHSLRSTPCGGHGAR